MARLELTRKMGPQRWGGLAGLPLLLFSLASSQNTLPQLAEHAGAHPRAAHSHPLRSGSMRYMHDAIPARRSRTSLPRSPHATAIYLDPSSAHPELRPRESNAGMLETLPVCMCGSRSNGQTGADSKNGPAALGWPCRTSVIAFLAGVQPEHAAAACRACRCPSEGSAFTSAPFRQHALHARCVSGESVTN